MVFPVKPVNYFVLNSLDSLDILVRLEALRMLAKSLIQINHFC
jgi:hypothetical protein